MLFILCSKVESNLYDEDFYIIYASSVMLYITFSICIYRDFYFTIIYNVVCSL